MLGRTMRKVRVSRKQLVCGLLLVSLLVGACRKLPASQSSQSRGPSSAQDAFRQPQRLIAALQLSPGDVVAEVGAGGGYLTRQLAQAVGPAGQVVATDIDGTALAALRERAQAEGLSQIQTRLVTAMEPGLEPGRYQLILLAQVDHLLGDRAAYLRALLPALSAAGRIAVSNREQHQAALCQAAAAAQLSCESVKVDLPGQFLVVLKRVRQN